MPVTSTRGRRTPSPSATPTPTGTTGTTGAAATTATTATTATGAADGAAGEGRAPRTRASERKPAPVVINGFGGKPLPSVNISLVPQPGQAGNAEARAEAVEGGWVERGYIDVRYQPAVGGVDVEVEAFMRKPAGDLDKYEGDEMVVYLQARVLDVTEQGGKERIITLATLFDGVWNGDKAPRSAKRFHVDYDQINAYLKQHSPHLVFQPGDPLAAYAIWKKAGHQWGGFMREGYFNAPAPIGKKTAVDARTGPTVAKAEVVSVSEAVKPIDITHKVPEQLVGEYPLVLEKGAKLVSRREHETKFCPKSLDELRDVTLKLMDIAAGSDRDKEKALLEMFGKDKHLSKRAGHPVSGWHISTTDRYYVKDAEGKVLKGADGLPLVAPMFDVYQDDPKESGYDKKRFPFAQQNMAVRFRDGEIKAGENVGSMGKLNMKTPRVADPFSLIQTGLELSLDTKPGITKNDDAMKQLATFLDKAPSPYNPLIEQKKVSYELKGANALGTAVNNLANRYKFTLEHESGMEIEISMDFVHAGFVFETRDVPATKGMDDRAKYKHYAKLLATPDESTLCVTGPLKEKRGEINSVVFQQPKLDEAGAATGEHELVMANFWLDDNGKMHATEHPAVRFPQVEMEMDHVQARSTGPVQNAYVKPSEVKNIANDADQEAFLKTVSEKVSMNGPPTTHTWEDLKDARLYDDANYAALAEAVTEFRTHLFPNGVEYARQKAAQALELGGYIPKQGVTLSASMPSGDGRDVTVGTNYQDRSRIEVKKGYGYGITDDAKKGTLGGKPTTVTVDWGGFPIKIPMKGTETIKEVAEAIQKRLDKAVLHKAELTEKDGVFTIAVTDR